MTADTESTSAALARVTAERDELREARDAARETLASTRGYLARARADRDELGRQHDLIEAELASARTELEQRGRAITEADARIRELEQLRAGSPTHGPGSTVRTRDADGNDHTLLIGDAGIPTKHYLSGRETPQ